MASIKRATGDEPREALAPPPVPVTTSSAAKVDPVVESKPAAAPSAQPQVQAPSPSPSPAPATPGPQQYEVTEFCGTLIHNGVTYQAGDHVKLSHEAAKALGKSVQPCTH